MGGVPNKKTPSLVDLSSDASNSPPPVVDLSQSDNLEIRDLFQTLVSMFPTTCREYLEEQAEELCGKPIALERFISEHLARNSQPPDYWQPRVQTIKTEQQESDSIGKLSTYCDSVPRVVLILKISNPDKINNFGTLMA